MKVKINWKTMVVWAVIFLLFCPSWLVGQKRVVAILDKKATVYEMMLREGCDPGWFYQVIKDSGLSTDLKQIEAGALKRVPVGKEIILPLPCSDPPSDEMSQKSCQVILANQKARRLTQPQPVLAPLEAKLVDKQGPKMVPPKQEVATLSWWGRFKNLFFRTSVAIVILLFVLLVGVLIGFSYLLKRRR